MSSVSVEELKAQLGSLQKQYSSALDSLGQATALKVKLEGAMDIVAEMIKRADRPIAPVVPPVTPVAPV